MVDDAAALSIGEGAFETVTNLDPHPAFITGNEDQDTVIGILSAELPGFHHPHRKVLERIAFETQNGEHRDLGSGLLFEEAEALLELSFETVLEHVRLIIDPAGEVRHLEGGDSGRHRHHDGDEPDDN